ADVNIPVGEVFTSPQLKGTNGVLHLKETFLKKLKFTDLKLTFKDGYVSDYDCQNYDDDEKNKKYIQENLLFPHKTLPIGEFAIGTNTQAYVMAKKFDILPILPVLIVEKMGPHFAIGDTCFSWEEDFKVYNPIDNKEITARENEKSALRKTDIQQAYTNCHTDITLPYEDLDFISAITKDGKKIDIIRDGRFVVPGTEELNVPLDEFEK
ncbi:MAG TPA: leucyl aminopeptidase, partial [Candidatus Cloacimonetes bacterium]|nr:leucyl aminopeptidase [Candidatus Cloacimonadota bacterium]